MSEIYNWSVDPNGYQEETATPNGIPEDTSQNAFCGVAREIMAATRRFYAEPEWQIFNDGLYTEFIDDSFILIYGQDVTALIAADSRVKLTGAGDVICNVASATWFPSQDYTQIYVDGTFAVGTNTIYRYIGQIIRTGGFTATGNTIGQIALHSSTGPLLTGAYKPHGNTTTNLALNSQTGPLLAGAYMLAGTIALKNAVLQTDINYNPSVEDDIWQGITFPVTPDGVMQFTITVMLGFNIADVVVSDRTAILFLHLGTGGTISDTIVARIPTSYDSNGGQNVYLYRFQVTPGATETISIGCSVQDPATLLGFASSPAYYATWYEIERVS